MSNHKKMTDDEYNAMTVPELRDLADERDIAVPSSATKAEIIAALKGGKHVEAREGEEGPVQEEVLVDPYEDFADPVIDGTKPIIDQVTPSNVVTTVVLDGSNVPTMPDDGKDYDHLVFVQSGRSQEWLSSEAAKRKFGQDKEGQIFFNAHGIDPATLKPVDIIALGT